MTNSSASRSGSVAAALVVATLAFGVRPASATDLVVTCPGMSLQAAINSLDPVGPHTITVTGTCTESVLINAKDRIELIGDGATEIASPSPTQAALLLLGAHNIEVRSLSLSGGFHGIQADRGSSVFVRDIRAYNNGRGIELLGNSTLLGVNVTCDHNGASGLRLDQSSATILGATITDNTGSGVVLTGSQLNIRSGPNTISQNGVNGIVVSSSSQGVVTEASIQNNAKFGVLIANASSLTLSSSTVSNNADSGINLQSVSHGTFNIGSVTNNGAATSGGGIHIGENSDAYLNGAFLVKDNHGSGIHVEIGAALSSLGGNTISGNSGDGVLVIRRGLAHFFGTDSITGNGGASVACDTHSLVVGDLRALSRVRCPSVTR